MYIDMMIFTATEALQMSGVPATTAIIIVAAVGWALLVIGLVLVVAVYIWRKKKRHYKTKYAICCVAIVSVG